MNPDFWHDRWKENQIGFHQSDYNHHLTQYLNLIAKSKKVFVPLCGKSKDMIWLMENGYDVIGVELSEIAVKNFFQENKIDYKIDKTDTFTIFKSDYCVIYCGDLFDLEKDFFDDCHTIYDRASLIALPIEMRKKYALKIEELLPNANTLLITIEYNQEKVNGPPFSVDKNELNNLFNFKKIELLESYEPKHIPIKFQENNISVKSNIFKLC